jgi:shikimate kinase
MHIFLMGFRGSGKSTVGRLLAQRIGWPGVDLDDCIEASAGRSIRQIFEDEGESGFREREQQALALVAAGTVPTVIALGGGAILRPANQQLIRTMGRCVWLQGSAEQLLQRISADATTAQRRPQLSQRSGYDEVVEILAAREPIYRQLAQLTVHTDHRSPDELVLEIVDWLKSAGQ